MPHNDSLVPKKHAFPRLFGQRPLTRVKDYSRAIRVDLIKHDDPEAMLDGTYDFVKATWSEDGRESERASKEEKREALSQMLQGKTLQLGLETVSFIFRISGITRQDTHQIVRQRIGVTFSQQCSGDQFWNHHDILIEPSIAYSDYNTLFLRGALESKLLYQEMLDDFENISIQAARSILPHCLETFIFMKVDLATLLFFHKKRIDDGSQTWQMNEIADQMASEVIKVFPDLREPFERNKTAFEFQRKASMDRKNTFSTGLYLPTPDDYEYHNEDYLYQKQKDAMHFVHEFAKPAVPTTYYWGMIRIPEERFILIGNLYRDIVLLAEESKWDKETQFVQTERLNLEIGEDLANDGYSVLDVFEENEEIWS